MEKYEVKYVNLKNGETMAYRQSGDYGPVLLMIHGNQTSSLFFEDFIGKFENRCRVYAIDLIGCGDSSYNREINSLREFSTDVALFMEAMELEDAFILGWSTGGGIAMELAADHTNLVQKLILMDSVSVKGYEFYAFEGEFIPVFNKRIFKREDLEKNSVVVTPMLIALENKDRIFIKAVFDGIVFNRKNPDKELFDLYIDAALKQRNFLDFSTALAQFNMTHENNGVVEGSGRSDLIKCPIVIIHGEDDLIIDVKNAKGMKEYFGNQASFHIIANSSHNPMMDRPRRLYMVIANSIFPNPYL